MIEALGVSTVDETIDRINKKQKISKKTCRDCLYYERDYWNGDLMDLCAVEPERIRIGRRVRIVCRFFKDKLETEGWDG